MSRMLVMKYSSSLCLYQRETHAILASSGNIPLLKQLLIAMANVLLKTFADSFISFGRILYMPADFLLSIFLKLFYITSRNLWKVAVSCCDVLYVIFCYSFDTSMVSKWLTNNFYCFFVVFNFLFFCIVGWFCSARAFYIIYAVVIASSFSSVTILSFSVNITSAFSRSPLFVRNGLMNFQKSASVWTPVFIILLI